jgi:hypothetical protein
MHLRVEDAGTYTVRAVNHLGEAISTSTLRVQGKHLVWKEWALTFLAKKRFVFSEQM